MNGVDPENIQPVSTHNEGNDKSVEQSIKDVLDAAPEELRPMIEKTLLKVTQYSGIMPHQDMMAAYEQLAPGATDRCLKIAESIVNTNNEVLLTAVKAEAEGVHDISTSRKRGQWMVFFLFLTGTVASFYLILKGQAWAGTAMFGMLAGLGGVLIYKDRREETTTRNENISQKN